MSKLNAADLPHPPGPEENWQESVVMFFADENNDVAGYVRLGCEPNQNVCQYWLYLQTPDGEFYRDMRYHLPVTDNTRREDGFGAGPITWRHAEGGRIKVIAEQPEAAVELDYVDYYPAMPCWKWIGGGDFNIGAPSHYEASGAISGKIRVGSKTYVIKSGMAHRDHSWGPRDGSRLRVARWFVGTLGPQLSYCVISFLDTDGHLAVGGWAVRNGKQEHAAEVDMVAHTNIDGVTIRGGRLRMTLEGGDVVDIQHDAILNFISAHNSNHGGGTYAGAESISRAYSGDLKGVGCFSVVNCVAGTTLPLAKVLPEFATFANGLGKLEAASPQLIDLSMKGTL